MAVVPKSLVELEQLHHKLYMDADALMKRPGDRVPFENLVFEGGGAKGVVYIGALLALAEEGLLPSQSHVRESYSKWTPPEYLQHGTSIKRIAGSSAGSIISLFVSMGYTPKECLEIISSKLDMKNLMDPRSEGGLRVKGPAGIPIGVADIINLIKNKGVFQGEAFKEIARTLTEEKFESKIKEYIMRKYEAEFELQANIAAEGRFSTKDKKDLLDTYLELKYKQFLDKYQIHNLGNLTFGQAKQLNDDVFSEYPDLKGLDLYVTGTCLTDGSLKVFSHETDKNMPMVDAVRISMSFPGGFEPVYYNGHYYADGGIADNYPFQIFNNPKYLTHGLTKAGSNPSTLGFMVDSEEEISERWGGAETNNESLNLTNFISHLLKSAHSRMDSIKDMHDMNTIQIFDVDIPVMDLEISDEKVQQAIERGKDTTQSFFSNYTSNTMGQAEVTYEDLYQKYFTMGEVQLKDALQSLGDSLGQLDGMIHVLEQQDLPEIYESLQIKLDAHENQEIVNEKRSLYKQINQLEMSLWDKTEQIKIAETKIEKIEVFLKRAQLRLAHLTAELAERELTTEEKQRIVLAIQKIELDSKSHLDYYNVQYEHINELQFSMYEEQERLTLLQPDKEDEIYNDIFQCEQIKNIIEDKLVETLKHYKEQYHEHLDVLFRAAHLKEITLRDPRVESYPQVTSEDIESRADIEREGESQDDSFVVSQNTDFDYALALEELSMKLGTGNYSDYISFASRSEMLHNATLTSNAQGEIVGKKATAYDVQKVKVTPNEKIKYKSYNKILDAPPFEAQFLIPEKASLQNKNKKTKDIIVVFQDPFREGSDSINKIGNYSLQSKCHQARAEHFDKYKDEFIQQIKWHIIKVRQEGLQPLDAKINLTLSGKGLSAMDAQLMMASLIKEMNDSDTTEYQYLDSIQLIVQDAPRVSDQRALDFAEDVSVLKQQIKSPRLNVYQLNHMETKKFAGPECYFGESSLTTYVKSNDMDVHLEQINKKNKLLASYHNKIQGERERIYEELNRHHWMYDTDWYRSFRTTKNQAKDFLKWLTFKFASTLAKIVYTFIKVCGSIPLEIVKIPFRIVMNLVSAIRDLFKKHTPKKIKSYKDDLMLAKSRHHDGESVSSGAKKDNLERAEQFLSASKTEKRLAQDGRPPIENLVIGGGGINQLGIIGSLKSLEKNHRLDDVKRLAGSSFGGVISMLLAIGYSPQELESIVFNELKLDKLADPACNWDPTLFKVKGHKIGISSIISLYKNQGLYRGEAFQAIVGGLVKQKLEENLKAQILKSMPQHAIDSLLEGYDKRDEVFQNGVVDAYLDSMLIDMIGDMDLSHITFEELEILGKNNPSLNLKEIFITGTKLSDHSLRVFSAQSDPNMPLLKAAMIGMTFPGTFFPQEYDGDYYVEGTISDGYAMTLFDKPEFLSHGLNGANVNPCTLGLKVDSAEAIKARWGVLSEQKRDLSLSQFADRLIKGIHTSSERLHDIYQINSVQVLNTRHENNHFILSNEQKNKLIESGEKEMDEYLRNYWSPDSIYQDSTRDLSYHNYMEKYYGKSEMQLIRLHEEELVPLIVEGQRVLNKYLQDEEVIHQELKQINSIESLHNTDSFDFAIACQDAQNDMLTALDQQNETLDNIQNMMDKAQKDIEVLMQPYSEDGDKIPSDIQERIILAHTDIEVLLNQLGEVQEIKDKITVQLRENQQDLDVIDSLLSQEDITAYRRRNTLLDRLELMDSIKHRVVELEFEEDVLFRALALADSQYVNRVGRPPKQRDAVKSPKTRQSFTPLRTDQKNLLHKNNLLQKRIRKSPKVSKPPSSNL